MVVFVSCGGGYNDDDCDITVITYFSYPGIYVQ